MERVKRIIGHVNAGQPGLEAQAVSQTLPVMENMKTKIAALAGEKTAFKNFLLKYHGETGQRYVEVLGAELFCCGCSCGQTNMLF